MQLAKLFKAFLIDLDGVVYVGSKPTEGAVETLNHLKNIGKKIVFVTNDPRSSANEYCLKLQRIGVNTTEEDIITSAMAIAHHIKYHHQNLHDMSAYVIGSNSLKEEISNTGIHVYYDEEGKNADFVIFGGHPEFHYNEMKIATLAIGNGAQFFATNRDPSYPTPEGHVPATGAMLASIEVACGKKATVVGKPETIIFEVAMAKHKLNLDDGIAMVGDRLDTDILGGKNAGIKTILALSGSTHLDDVSKSELKPDYIINDLRGLLLDTEPL